MNSYWNGYTGAFVPGVLAGWLSMFVIPIAIWSLFWMGMALWKAARNGSKAWFIVLLLVHTLGILDILYIFVFSKMGEAKPKLSKKSK
ncbi:MAG: hypothetical protein ACD_13C00134G0014 [uncultured bacterium]|nr:MAG: hypothetical protein ACD_13C00134G0014 [uncultured bacterium]KKR53784.1 MAG: hypothetical protein UT88_C0006G0023 [Candidatus Woesebacteria bacterium GW2011_GWD2_40_19]